MAEGFWEKIDLQELQHEGQQFISDSLFKLERKDEMIT